MAGGISFISSGHAMPKGFALFILFILIPMSAGVFYGRLPERRSFRESARPLFLAGVLVGLAACILLLAKLFHSNTLGWLFGLSLIFGLPLLILFGIGFAIGSALNRRTTNRPLVGEGLIDEKFGLK